MPQLGCISSSYISRVLQRLKVLVVVYQAERSTALCTALEARVFMFVY